MVGYVKPDGTGVVEDRWAGAYAPPLADASQGCSSIDIFLSQNLSHNNLSQGMLKFSRNV